MPFISVPGNSHYEAECHYPSSSNNTQASLTISGCSLTFSSVEMFNFVQMVFHRQQTKISKSGIRWSGNGFSQIRLSFSLSFFRNHESIIYTSLWVPLHFPGTNTEMDCHFLLQRLFPSRAWQCTVGIHNLEKPSTFGFWALPMSQILQPHWNSFFLIFLPVQLKKYWKKKKERNKAGIT